MTVYYFHHPESGCVFRDIKKDSLADDGNVVKLTKEEYYKLVEEYRKIRIEDRRREDE